jgi:hypothetical protein
MYVRSFANAAPVVVRHTAVSAAAVTSSTASTAVGYGTAGEVMYALNHLSLGRDDLRLRRVKTCIDQARTGAMSLAELTPRLPCSA